eukprot:6436476-Amphidinium_carterae.1
MPLIDPASSSSSSSSSGGMQMQFVVGSFVYPRHHILFCLGHCKVGRSTSGSSVNRTGPAAQNVPLLPDAPVYRLCCCMIQHYTFAWVGGQGGRSVVRLSRVRCSDIRASSARKCR